MTEIWPMQSEPAPGPTPTCRYCGKRLHRDPHSKANAYGYNGEGLFCTLRCGYSFGRESAQLIDKGEMFHISNLEAATT